jgi:hypothetical protein
MYPPEKFLADNTWKLIALQEKRQNENIFNTEIKNKLK